MMYWSWPVIQMVCVVVVWAWSRVFVRLIEEATNRGLAQWPPRKGAIGAIVSGRQPVLASTRFGRVSCLDHGGHHAVCAVGVRVLGIVYLLISRESAAGARTCGKYR